VRIISGWRKGIDARKWIAAAAGILGAVPVAAQHADTSRHGGGETDSTYRAMQARGKVEMGVDQYTSTHRFDALPDGGRIELRRNSEADTAGIQRVRAHLRDIARAFKAGDFSAPTFVHMQSVPGVQAMAAKRDVITYLMRELPRGGEVRVTTHDADALRAIHEFMAFQRGEHHAGGRDDARPNPPQSIR
jgi:hypothetical protein